MENKTVKICIAVVCAALGASGVLVACGGGNASVHEHTFDTESWVNTDPEYHWHKATCEHTDEVSDRAKHTFTDGECTVCHYRQAAALAEDESKPVTTIIYKDMRLQLLSDTVVRIEDKSNGAFEDRASYTVQNRADWGAKVEYAVNKTDGGYDVVTDCYTVTIPENGTAEDVRIVNSAGKTLYEFYGKTGTNVYLPSPSEELSSWYFTDSPRAIPSEAGYKPTTAPLNGWTFDEKATDIYAFVPQGNYKTLTEDFVTLTGRSEMVNLKMLGMWDSRYYAYTDETALKQIDDYKSHGFSLDMLTIDTDWRSTAGGWGYDVNTELFPDMRKFLSDAHEKGVGIVFNDHPQPVSGTSNLLDKAEIEYRTEKLKALLEMGVDYWWYDRNWSVSLNKIQSDYSRYATGMYAFYEITKDYYESVKQGDHSARPLIMGNVDGCNNGSYVYASDLSAHRYSVQWSGDIGSKNDWLKQSIEGAVMAGAELGLAYVSEDIGGHNDTPSGDEYTRWFQYGALSPIMRVHCYDKETRGRMPWMYGATAEEVAHTYLDMRYRLLPLFYALAHENYETGLPIMRRLDIAYPQYVESESNDEYLLGDYVLVAPISQFTSAAAKRDVFIPDGKWIDVWTGERYSGPQTVSVTHGIKTSPIFVREGALIALARNMQNVDEKDWSEMTLDVYPSADYAAKTTVYEDDAETLAYTDGKYRKTDIAMSCAGNTLKIDIGKAVGSFTGKRAFIDRKWNVRLHKNPDWGNVKSVKVNGSAVSAQTLAALTYENGGRPFAYTGGALDGEIKAFALDTKTDKSYTIEIEYESVTNSGKCADYDATEVKFDVTVADCTDTSVDLTALGTTDWVSFGYNSGTSVDYKKNGPRLFGAPADRRTMIDAPTLKYKSAQIKTGLEKTYTDGHRKASNTVAGGTKNVAGYDLTVKTTGNKQTVVLYVGGGNSLAKLNIRDRAGNVRTVNVGGRDKADFTKKVTIEIEAGDAGELTVQYCPVACTVVDQDTSSYLVMYCGYIFDKDPGGK